MFPSEIIQLTPFESGSTFWDSDEPVFIDPSLYAPSLFPCMSIFDPDEPIRKTPKTLAPRPRLAVDERKRRRIISNRDSARRSRVRKQKHLENLKNILNRLVIENREVLNQLRLTAHEDGLIRQENGELQSESVLLRKRLWDMRQILLVRQLEQHLMNPVSAWPCNDDLTYINEDQSTINALLA